MIKNILDSIDENRRKNNFLTIEEIVTNVCSTNTVYNELTLLISRDIVIGKDNIFFPNVIIETEYDGKVNIGDNNTFGSGTNIYVESGQEMVIGSNCRFDGTVKLYGNTIVGNGCQVLGFIQVYNCILEEGENFKESNPNLRGAVLKGVGRAKNLKVRKGYVINGLGDFKQEQEELQINYHK